VSDRQLPARGVPNGRFSAPALSREPRRALGSRSRHRAGGNLLEKLAAIEGSGFLSRIPSELGGQLVASALLVDYPAGCVSAPAPGSPWAAVVCSGLFREYLPTPDGRQVTVRYAGIGDLVGYPSSDSRWLRTEIEAVEPSELIHFDVPHIERLARREPEVAMALAEELANLLRHAYRTLAGSAFATVRSRVARDLLERAARAEAPRSGTRVRVTQQALANATGSVREVVARALRELRLNGVIETDRSGITILKVDALLREAGQSD
jgi:CRP/FNR family transcriptional regulator, cyclic AMP receptor protein